MKSVLVTGNNGLVGQQVVEALLNEGYSVTGISTGKDSKCQHEMFKYISADLTRSTELEKIFRDNEFSHVIHLAAIAHAFKGRNISWSRYYRVNTMMSRQVFECAISAKIPIFFSSTVDVYGITNGVINENTEPKPIGPYGRSKYLAEKSLIGLDKHPYLIARFAPIYTEGDHHDMHRRYYISYPKLCYLIGDGMEYEFLYSKNAVNIILEWIKSPGTLRGIVNVCDAKRYNTKELIKVDKDNGLATMVFRIPKWLKRLMHISVNIVFCTNLFLKFTAYKIIFPMRFDSSKLNEILQKISDNF
ncbi:NAD-dependent epimerase/dehydratase family protein [Clostridium sp.]|uniref:NAD-dependent epimerase/dehydratase family protein n=1 Tax=Clostridium sp. TaxID=1506 RepID=UPI003D6CFE61